MRKLNWVRPRKSKGPVNAPSSDQVAKLVKRGIPEDLAKRVDRREAESMIRRLPEQLSETETDEQQKRRSTPLGPFPPEDGEATDAQLLKLKRLGGKYGNRHRRT
jgi:hypothetical protein